MKHLAIKINDEIHPTLRFYDPYVASQVAEAMALAKAWESKDMVIVNVVDIDDDLPDCDDTYTGNTSIMQSKKWWQFWK